MTAGDTVAGTVEIGVSLMSMMELAKSTTGADFAIFLDPQFVPDGKGGYGRKGQALTLNVSTDNHLFAAIQTRGLVAMTREPASDILDHDGRSLGLLARPLLDYSGQAIGMLLVAKDFSAAESAFRGSWITVAVVAVCGFLVAYGLVMVVLRSLVFRPLEALAVDAADGRAPAAASRLESYLRLRDGVIDEMRRARTDRQGEAE